MDCPRCTWPETRVSYTSMVPTGPVDVVDLDPAPQGALLARHRVACAVCQHDQRDEIERAYLGWMRLSHIARLFDVSEGSVRTHARRFGLVRAKADTTDRLYVRLIERALETIETTGLTFDQLLQLCDRLDRHRGSGGGAPSPGEPPARGRVRRTWEERVTATEERA